MLWEFGVAQHTWPHHHDLVVEALEGSEGVTPADPQNFLATVSAAALVGLRGVGGGLGVVGALLLLVPVGWHRGQGGT